VNHQSRPQTQCSYELVKTKHRLCTIVVEKFYTADLALDGNFSFSKVRKLILLASLQAEIETINVADVSLKPDQK